MDVKTAILHYYPYWILGILMIVATLFSEFKDLMVIKPKSIWSFTKIMAKVTVFRSVLMYFFPPTLASVAPVLKIPLWLTGTVFWEDAAHTLPLAIAARILGNTLPAKVMVWLLTAIMMVSFGLGHTYQGILTACMISFYIPIVTNLGKKHGFGTVMVCHCMYDFITLLTIRLFLGL